LDLGYPLADSPRNGHRPLAKDMSTLFGIEESRWLPNTRGQRSSDSTRKGDRRGQHVSPVGLSEDRPRVLRKIWHVWSFRSGALLVLLTLIFAVIPKGSGLAIVNWIVGSLLILVCIFVFTFQIVVGAKLGYLKLRNR
jgi:hypothetical protein